MSDNGTMFWPATTTTAIIDPTSQEILSDILNKKVSIGDAGNVASTVLPPVILESISIDTLDIIMGSDLIGKTYYHPDTKKIRHFYADSGGLNGVSAEHTDPSPELIYYDKETDKLYRWNATTQEMISIVAETSGGEPTFLDIDLADLEPETVSTFLTNYYPSSEEDPLPSSTFEDSEGKYKNIILRIRVLEEDNPEGMTSEDIDENYWNFPLKLTPLVLETTDNVWNDYGNILFGSYTYFGFIYSAYIGKDINDNYSIGIQKIKLKNLGIITSLSAYENVPVYPTAGDDINIAFGKINRIIQSHEEVTARALLDLDSRIQNLPSGGGGGIWSTSWSALKTLRDGGNLTPGQFYRITDYTCTTTQTDTQSAGHVFDIIVLALSESTLSETAWADHHEGDTYFSNCRLEAWELKYCLDNDTNRFIWADTTNGKGVIYWMKDEWNNECPYDFKNIQFKRWAISTISAPSGSRVNSAGVAKLDDTFAVGNGHNIKCSYRSGNYTISNLLSIETGSSLFYYTFQHIQESGGAYDYYDLSISKGTLDPVVLDFYIDDGTDVNIQNSCRHNVIEKTTYKNDSEGITITYPEKQVLNNIIFIGYSDYDDFDNYCTTIECSNNIIKEGGCDITILFGSECRCNQFGTGCNSNLLGKNLTTFNNNIFGDGCYNNVLAASNTNTFGHGSGLNVFIGENYHNMFGDSFKNNVLGEGCAYNIIKSSFYNNTFGNFCYYNTFGVMCHDNTFGNNCSNNILGNYCYNNTFGDSCSYNVFGGGCSYNTFIFNGSSYNKIGSGCSSITRAGTNPITQLKNCEIGEGCNNIVFSPSYFKNITIEQGIKYLQMSPGGGTTSSDIYQNYRFCSGIEGTSSNWKFITLPSANNNFLTTYKPANSVEISV